MWMKTLDGQDVFEQGDGWVFYGREQQWFHEPNLLTMPAAPLGARLKGTADNLKGEWPTLRQAWSLSSPSFSIGHLLLRIPPLVAALYFVWHIPMFWREHQMTEMQRNATQYAAHEFSVLVGLSVLSLFCLWILWVDHVGAVDKKKGNAITAAVFGGVATIEVVRFLRKIGK